MASGIYAGKSVNTKVELAARKANMQKISWGLFDASISHPPTNFPKILHA
jgi:hypothetical protein